MKNIENFSPSWNEVLKQCPEVVVLDIIKFAGAKRNCKPAWASLGYQGLSDNRVSGKDLSGFLTTKEAATVACTSKTKKISTRPVLSQSLNAVSLSSNPVGTKIEDHVETEEEVKVTMGV